jgi:hypothetical protein
MKSAHMLSLGAIIGCLALTTAGADERHDREDLERYHRAMDSIWDSAFDSPDNYAAIAYSPATGKYGYSYSHGTLASAQRDALARCGAADAQIVVWSRNSYCALAKGEDNAYGAGHGPTRAQAQAAALRECRKHASECRIVQWVFSGSGR